MNPKFHIGQTVYNTVSKRGSYGPNMLNIHNQLTIDKIEITNNKILYTCGYEGWQFTEDELISSTEYAQQIILT